MTNDVELNDRRVAYTAAAGQTVFDIDFPLVATSDIAVYKNGVLLESADYTVSLSAMTVTLDAAAAEGNSVVVEGATIPVRESAYPLGGALSSSILNLDIRRCLYLAQEILTKFGRCLSLNPSEGAGVSLSLPVRETGKMLKWGASGLVNSSSDIDALDSSVTAAAASASSAASSAGTATTQAANAAASAAAAAAMTADGALTYQKLAASAIGTTSEILSAAASKIVTAAALSSVLGAISFSSAQESNLLTGTTTTPYDDTIPQNTEGTQFLSVTMTPKKASSILVIDICLAAFAATTNNEITGALFRDSGADAIAAWDLTQSTTVFSPGGVTLRHVVTAGSVAATTFKFRMGVATSGTVTLNGRGGARKYGGVAISSISVTEFNA